VILLFKATSNSPIHQTV